MNNSSKFSQNEQIASQIKDLCKEKSISVKTLLEDCNITKGFIYDLEKLNKTPSIEKLKLIADYLDVPVDYLLTGDKEVRSNIYVDDGLDYYIGRISGGGDKFKKAFVKTICMLSEEEWNVLKNISESGLLEKIFNKES